ncbi:MAG: universal stress protein [Cyclobacteriaceae bacterium]
MEFYNNWLVGLDMTETDSFIMQNIASLGNLHKPEKITILHVVDPPDLPKEVIMEIPDLHLPELLHFENRIREMVSEYDLEGDIEIVVREGHPLTVILETLDSGNHDLIVIGKKGKEGSVERKIARKAGISALFIPEKQIDLKHILVPVDFSEHSKLALDVAAGIASKVEDVSCLHVYRDSSKYISQVVETLDDVQNLIDQRNILDQKLAAYAEHKLNQTMSEYPHFKPHVYLEGINKTFDIGDFICEWAAKHPADMVIIGARGKTSAAAALLGAVSEQVFLGLSDRLMLMVKKPGENVSLIKALLRK